jgi:hypothetical protein
MPGLTLFDQTLSAPKRYVQGTHRTRPPADRTFKASCLIASVPENTCQLQAAPENRKAPFGAALHPFGGRYTLGFDGQMRLDLGSNAAKLDAHHEARFDALLGPAATVALGPIVCVVQAGGSVVRFHEASAAGLFVVSGIGAVF